MQSSAFRALLSLALASLASAQDPTPATLEMRALANSDYDAGGVRFDLAEERRRLLAWLGEGEHMQAVIDDPQRIHLFNWRPAEHGGPRSAMLAWYPSAILPSTLHPGQWDFSFSEAGRDAAVALFSAAEYAAGPTETCQQLFELLPINLHDRALHPRRSGSRRNRTGPGPAH